MTCQKDLMALGKPYPRTCQDCGLGPCKNIVATPVALQLAKDLDRVGAYQSANELRRLFYMNKELLKALKKAKPLLEASYLDHEGTSSGDIVFVGLESVREAIAKAQGETQ